MDAGKLVQDILEARDIVRGVLPKYIGKPYTGYTMNCMEDVELYANVIATSNLHIPNGSVSGFLEARKYEGQGNIEKPLNKNLLCD